MAKVASIGIPVKLLHEGLGHTITVETKTGMYIHPNYSNIFSHFFLLIAA